MMRTQTSMLASALFPVHRPALEVYVAVETYMLRGRTLGLDVDQLTDILRAEIDHAHTRDDVTPADALEAASRRALETACAQEFATA